MKHGYNRRLNVFQLTPLLYYNSGVCQLKTGIGIIFIHILFNFSQLTLSVKSERSIQPIVNVYILPCIVNL
jgi:hypothetical protein